MMPSIFSDYEAAIIGGAAVLGIVGGWLRWVRPRARRFSEQVVAMRDSILGREAINDSITGVELSPALPGVGVRLAATEQHLGVLAEAVATIAQSHRRLDDHETRLIRLEDAAFERVVGKAESAAAWQAMSDVARSQPPPPDEAAEL